MHCPRKLGVKNLNDLSSFSTFPLSNTQSFKSEYLKSPIVPLAIGVTFQTGRSVAEKKNKKDIKNRHNTRSSWLNCSLRDDEAVYWFSIGHYEAVAVGN